VRSSFTMRGLPPNADCKPPAYMGLQSPVSGEMSRADETGQAVTANST
jgi:hypothetical protein